jgi:hypothetical protein
LGSATRRRQLAAVALVVVIVGTLAAWLAPDEIGNRVAPPVTVISGVGSGTLSPEEQLYADGLRPYLDVLVGEGRSLEKLGQARSRNIVELSLRMDRYRTAANNIEQYIQGHSTPPGLVGLVTELRQRIDESLAAIDASVAAIRRFDWNALGQTVDDFSLAVDHIARLAGTPVPAASPGQ